MEEITVEPNPSLQERFDQHLKQKQEKKQKLSLKQKEPERTDPDNTPSPAEIAARLMSISASSSSSSEQKGKQEEAHPEPSNEIIPESLQPYVAPALTLALAAVAIYKFSKWMGWIGSINADLD